VHQFTVKREPINYENGFVKYVLHLTANITMGW